MNLISFNTQNYNLSSIVSNWTDSKPLPDLIDNYTYDLYESDNPFNRTFSQNDISNNELRFAVNATAKVGAEAFSAFANPYYLSHKITHIPIYYQSVVDKYKNE